MRERDGGVYGAAHFRFLVAQLCVDLQRPRMLCLHASRKRRQVETTLPLGTSTIEVYVWCACACGWDMLNVTLRYKPGRVYRL